MKLLHVQSLALEAVKVVRLARFPDDRGYFAENYRVSDFQRLEGLEFLGGSRVLQCNESFSRPGTIRGLHFQWNPFQGKLVRTVFGRMVDMVLDIRLTSPTFGKIICYDLPEDRAAAYQEWIWVPPGFAAGFTPSPPTSSRANRGGPPRPVGRFWSRMSGSNPRRMA